MSPKHFYFAYLHWVRHNYQEHAKTDEDIGAFLNIELSSPWLEKARRAKFLSCQSIADKLGISKSGYRKLEIQEQSGSITLATLAKAADALDCELVYALRPEKRRKFSEEVWWPLAKKFQNDPGVKSAPENRKGMVLAAVIERKVSNPGFHSTQGWAKGRN